MLEEVKPIGYHAWVDPSTVMVFVLGEPATLQRATPGSATVDIVTGGIGRSLVSIPGTRAVSFTQRDSAGRWWFHRYDADTRMTRPLVQAPEGAGEPFGTWSRDGRLYTASGTRILSWKDGEGGWTLVGDLSAAPIRNLSRLAISFDGRWLAIVGEPVTADGAR